MTCEDTPMSTVPAACLSATIGGVEGAISGPQFTPFGSPMRVQIVALFLIVVVAAIALLFLPNSDSGSYPIPAPGPTVTIPKP